VAGGVVRLFRSHSRKVNAHVHEQKYQQKSPANAHHEFFANGRRKNVCHKKEKYSFLLKILFAKSSAKVQFSGEK
jgi:hypothetical protein